MRIYSGDLTITKDNSSEFQDVAEVTGSLDIYAEANLPVLTSVGGGLYIDAEASLPVLASVGGDLDIYAEASLPVLASVGGDLSIRAESSLPVLASVGGGLSIRAESSLPVLASVGGGLSIRAESSLPVLASVGGFKFGNKLNCTASFEVMLKNAHSLADMVNCADREYGIGIGPIDALHVEIDRIAGLRV